MSGEAEELLPDGEEPPLPDGALEVPVVLLGLTAGPAQPVNEQATITVVVMRASTSLKRRTGNNWLVDCMPEVTS